MKLFYNSKLIFFIFNQYLGISIINPSGYTVRLKGPFSKNNPSVELAPGPPLSHINNG